MPRSHLKDIQAEKDDRNIPINQVGVKDISYPVIILDREEGEQHTVAKVNMYVDLPHNFRGTHMSRFIEILNRFHGEFNLRTFHLILEAMKARLEAEAAHLEMAFPYFLHDGRAGAVPGMQRYECRLHGSLAETLDLAVEVDVPVPLAAGRLSGRGLKPAAGLWGMVTAMVRMNRFLWIEDLIDLVEGGAAREPESQESVESMCRAISETLAASESFRWYKVVVKNMSSGYSAFASSEWPEPMETGQDRRCGPIFAHGV